MNRLFKWGGIGFLVGVAVVGWKVGEQLTPAQAAMIPGLVFGFIFAVGVSAIALSAQRARVDVYHHNVTETPVEPQKQPQRMIPARPTSYIVIDDLAQLQTATQQRLEVTR